MVDTQQLIFPIKSILLKNTKNKRTYEELYKNIVGCRIKNNLLIILNNYLLLFPKEKERYSRLLVYLEKSNDKDIIDWNSFNENIVTGGFTAKRKIIEKIGLNSFEKK